MLLQNITVQLETNFMNYMVKPKVFLTASTTLHCIAAHFFFFSALRARSPFWFYTTYIPLLWSASSISYYLFYIYSKRYDIKKRSQNVLDLKLQCCYWFACIHLCWTVDQSKMILMDIFYSWTGPLLSFHIWMFVYMLENIGKGIFSLVKYYVIPF